MSESIRSQLLDSLEHNWGELVAHFYSLPPSAQEAWLAQQGYARLADLLAHVIAWWEEAMPIISRLAAREEVENKEYDEDRFNAEAVGRFANYNETMVIAAFETARKRWVMLVSELPDAALSAPRIAERLRIELIRHYQEHTLAAE